MADLRCGAPPRRITRGGTEYIESCNRPSFTWNASKGGHTEQIVRCNEHAAQLRSSGFDVRIASDVAKAPARKKWNLTSTNSLDAADGYLRKNSGAVLVLVVRTGDAVVAVDEGVSPDDIDTVIGCALQEALDRLRGKGQNSSANVEGRHV